MSLEDLKKKIYKPGSEFEERIKRPNLAKPFLEQQQKESWQQQPRKKFKISLTASQKKTLKKILLILGAVLIVLAGLAIWQGLTSFDKHKVEVEIMGAEKTSSGEELTYTVKYFNGTKVTLEEAHLTFYFPEGSMPSETDDLIYTIEVPDVAPQEEVSAEFKVRLIGLKEEEQQVRAKLEYKPHSFNARFDNSAELTTKIIAVPLSLDFDLPSQLVSGQTFNFSLEFLNEADVAFDDLVVRLAYPAGFAFNSAVPQADERDNLWRVNRLKAGEQREIYVEGSIQGQEGDSKSFQAQIGFEKDGQFIPYSEKNAATNISVSPLYISQTVNNQESYIAKAGETLTYRLNYQNTTGVGINDVVITAKLEGVAYNLNSLKLGQGSYDGLSQQIVWRTSNLSELSYLGPNAEGSVEFSIDVKDPLPIYNFSDKNFILTSTATINSNQPPLALKDIQLKGESRLESKISTQLIIDTKGFYNDEDIPNSGQIPPKVGEKTTYTLKFNLANTANDVKEAKVMAYLPPHVNWQNKIEPADQDISYNQETGQVVWDVGVVNAATQLLMPAKWVAFQVSITPASTHVGSTMDLIGETQVTGQDMFTGLSLSAHDSPIDTELPDDAAIKRQDGTVVE